MATTEKQIGSHFLPTLFMIFVCCSCQSFAYYVNMTSYFGTKAPYRHAINPNPTPPPFCEAVHLNIVLRHGARFPSSGDKRRMENMVKALNSIYSDGSNFTYKNFSLPRKFPAKYKEAASSELSRMGETEHYRIARRLLSRYPKVLSAPYGNSLYSFLSSNKERTTQSASAFAYGLFQGRGGIGPEKFQPVALEVSNNIRFYENCEYYEKISETTEWLGEYYSFQKGPEMMKVKENLERKLKLAGKLDLTTDNVRALFRLCMFGVITDNDKSWCDLFDLDDLLAAEYLTDLKKYYESSYGHEMNYKISCPLVRDIMKNLEEFTEEKKPRGIFRFGHSQTVLPLMSVLGLFRDNPPLRADNFKMQGDRELWSARVVPMAANVAFVVYQCDGNPKERLRVQVLVNEAAVPIEACKGEETCPLETFISYYNNTVRSCDAEFKRLCSLPLTGGVPDHRRHFVLKVLLALAMYTLCWQVY